MFKSKNNRPHRIPFTLNPNNTCFQGKRPHGNWAYSHALPLTHVRQQHTGNVMGPVFKTSFLDKLDMLGHQALEDVGGNTAESIIKAKVKGYTSTPRNPVFLMDIGQPIGSVPLQNPRERSEIEGEEGIAFHPYSQKLTRAVAVEAEDMQAVLAAKETSWVAVQWGHIKNSTAVYGVQNIMPIAEEAALQLEDGAEFEDLGHMFNKPAVYVTEPILEAANNHIEYKLATPKPLKPSTQRHLERGLQANTRLIQVMQQLQYQDAPFESAYESSYYYPEVQAQPSKTQHRGASSPVLYFANNTPRFPDGSQGFSIGERVDIFGGPETTQPKLSEAEARRALELHASAYEIAEQEGYYTSPAT